MRVSEVAKKIDLSKIVPGVDFLSLLAEAGGVDPKLSYTKILRATGFSHEAVRAFATKFKHELNEGFEPGAALAVAIREAEKYERSSDDVLALREASAPKPEFSEALNKGRYAPSNERSTHNN